MSKKKGIEGELLRRSCKIMGYPPDSYYLSLKDALRLARRAAREGYWAGWDSACDCEANCQNESEYSAVRRIMKGAEAKRPDSCSGPDCCRNREARQKGLPKMSGEKWTKGPWNFREHAPEFPYVGDIEADLGPRLFQTVAIVLKNAPAIEQQANGRLIAAAPDMAEALKEIAEMRLTCSCQGQMKAQNIARAALEKVRGGE